MHGQPHIRFTDFLLTFEIRIKYYAKKMLVVCTELVDIAVDII
jgi:hypothetical protein